MPTDFDSINQSMYINMDKEFPKSKESKRTKPNEIEFSIHVSNHIWSSIHHYLDISKKKQNNWKTHRNKIKEETKK